MEKWNTGIMRNTRTMMVEKIDGMLWYAIFQHSPAEKSGIFDNIPDFQLSKTLTTAPFQGLPEAPRSAGGDSLDL